MKYKLTVECEEDEFLLLKAMMSYRDAHSAIYEIKQMIRQLDKHGNNFTSVEEAITSIREKIREIINDNNVIDY